MLDLIILIVLFAGIITGLRRGFIVQIMHFVGFFIALIVAYINYKKLADVFVYWVPYPGFSENAPSILGLDNIDVDQTFYRALAFVVIFFIVKIVFQILASMFNFIAYLPVLNTMNRFLGMILGFVEFYILLFIALYILALVPLAQIQSLMSGSIFAGLIVEHTPILTNMLQNWWYIYTSN
jgi:uncharacterized membrane protein required for colicin V production